MGLNKGREKPEQLRFDFSFLSGVTDVQHRQAGDISTAFREEMVNLNPDTKGDKWRYSDFQRGTKVAEAPGTVIAR